MRLSDIERAAKIEELLLDIDNWSTEQLYDAARDAENDRLTDLDDEELLIAYNSTFEDPNG